MPTVKLAPRLIELLKSLEDKSDLYGYELKELRALLAVARAVGRIGIQWPGTIPEAWRPYLHLVRISKGAR